MYTTYIVESDAQARADIKTWAGVGMEQVFVSISFVIEYDMK